MATAVISASEATHYVHHLWEGLLIIPATIGLLAFFMGLTILGIGESSIVAVIIFITHILTLTLLIVIGSFFLFNHGFDTLTLNYSQPVQGAFFGPCFLVLQRPCWGFRVLRAQQTL
jgi:glucose-6-phosphate-specific signal transduction histidine kinase